MQVTGEFGELAGRADGNRLDTAVRQITDIAGHPGLDGAFLREIAKTDALHPSAYHIAAGLNPIAFRHTIDYYVRDISTRARLRSSPE